MRKIRIREDNNEKNQIYSHFIFPESLIKLIIPAAAYDLLLPLIFKETKGYVQECRESRSDFDAHIRATVREWMEE